VIDASPPIPFSAYPSFSFLVAPTPSLRGTGRFSYIRKKVLFIGLLTRFFHSPLPPLLHVSLLSILPTPSPYPFPPPPPFSSFLLLIPSLLLLLFSPLSLTPPPSPFSLFSSSLSPRPSPPPTLSPPLSTRYLSPRLSISYPFTSSLLLPLPNPVVVLNPEHCHPSFEEIEGDFLSLLPRDIAPLHFLKFLFLYIF